MATLMMALFLAIAVVHLGACALKMRTLRHFTKPMLMPALAIWYLLAAQNVSALVVIGLLLGAAGDTFLINPQRQLYFILGISAFALGHVCYIVYMGRALMAAPPLWLLLLLIVALCIVLFIVYRMQRAIVPKRMRPAIFFYMLLLILLLSFASLYWHGGHSGLPFVGAILFMLSDFVLSNEYFRGTTRYGGGVLMTTYILAQLCLAVGFAAG